MARQKTAWDKLSMRDRAQFIRLGVQHGLSNLKDIKGYYNLYSNGGSVVHKFDGEQIGQSQELQLAKINEPHERQHVEYQKEWLNDWYSKRLPTINKQHLQSFVQDGLKTEYQVPASQYTNPENFIVLDENALGEYIPPMQMAKTLNGSYIGTSKPRIALKDVNFTTPVHEFNHAIHFGAGNDFIPDFTNGKTGTFKDDYLTRPWEQHSRIMELRYNNRLDPLKTNYTIDDVNRMRDGYIGNDAILSELKQGGMTDEDIVNALNNWASNNNAFEQADGRYLSALGGSLAHKKSGKEQGESQDLNYPNLLPEVEVHPKWYDQEWAKRSAAGLSALGTIATYIPNQYAKAAGLIAQIPDMYYDTRSLVSDVKNTDNWIDESLNTLILDPFFRKKRPLIEQLGKGADYLGPFKKINIPLSALDAINDGYYAITGNKLSKDVQSLVDNKKSTGGPLYPFSFEKNPFLKTPVVRYDEGGQKQDASNPGGYTDEQLNNNYQIWKTYDPTGGLNFFNYIASQNSGNLARGEENEYWKEYLGLDSAVPLMNSNAYTEWDKQIEAQKKQNGELTSDFYGTTPRMDYNIQALADTLMLGNMVRNYAEYDKMYDLPHIETVTEAYEQAKNILNNPNQWTFVNGEIPIGGYRYDSKTSETNPLGMLSHFGMKWVPEENALYMHDTYDFPNKVYTFTDIPIRPREMKIRSKINFDPIIGSWLLRSPVNYNTEIPVNVTK